MDEKIHIGKLIQKKMEEDGRSARWLAKKIHCDRSNIYRIFQRQHIDVEQLILICVQLEIDLFAKYSEYIHKQIHQKKDKPK